MASAGDDILFGGALMDVLEGGAGNDTLVGEDGRDIVDGDSGNDALWADRDDALRSSFGLPIPATDATLSKYNDLLAREDDLTVQIDALDKKSLSQGLTGEEAARRKDLASERAIINMMEIDVDTVQTVVPNMLEGGEGNDTLRGGDGADFLDGGAGDDLIYHSSGDDQVDGGTGNDTYMIQGTDAADRIAVRYGSTADHPDAVIVTMAGRAGGTARSDKTKPTSTRADRLEIETVGVRAGGGDDSIVVDFGTRVPMTVSVDGGDGRDAIDATGLQAGATLRGGAGDDTITAGLKRRRARRRPGKGPLGRPGHRRRR